MKVKINKAALVKTLNGLKGAANRNILFNAENDTLSLTGVGETAAIRITLGGDNVQVEHDGKMLIEHKFITEAVKKMDGEEVTINATDGVCMLYDEKSKFRLHVENEANFPAVDFDGEDAFEISTSVLADAVNATDYCISRVYSTERPFINGLQLESAGGQITAIASDGYRAAKKTIVYDGPAFKVIIPLQTLGLLKDTVFKDAPEATVKVSFKKNPNTGVSSVIFETEGIKIRSSLIASSFPSLPFSPPFVGEMTVDRKHLRSVVERSLFLANMAEHETIELSETDGVKITTLKQEIGGSTEEVACTYTGTPLKLSYNAAYLNDTLKAISDDELKIGFAGEMKPIILSAADEVHLILPVLTRE